MSGEPRWVHVVDDDASFRGAVARLLRRLGYEVQTYDSVAGFLADAPEEKAGCVLLDLRMPGRSGLELQEELRNAGLVLPVIFVSAHGDVSTSVRAIRRGAEDFLTKPVSRAELVPAIERALARGEAEQVRKTDVDGWRTRYEALTERERAVLDRVVAGRLNKQIAGELGIAIGTVKIHRGRVMTKLGIHSLVELVRVAESLGLRAGAVRQPAEPAADGDSP